MGVLSGFYIIAKPSAYVQQVGVNDFSCFCSIPEPVWLVKSWCSLGTAAPQ